MLTMTISPANHLMHIMVQPEKCRFWAGVGLHLSLNTILWTQQAALIVHFVGTNNLERKAVVFELNSNSKKISFLFLFAYTQINQHEIA
jgi:hypothetical protein